MSDRAGDQREDRRCRVAASFAADEEPVFAADGDPAQRSLRRIVVDGELAVVGVAAECFPLVEGS